MTQPTTTACPDCGPEGTAGLSRRSLLRIAAAGTVGAVAASAGVGTQYAFAAGPAAASSSDVLVVLSLRGGFDGLNVVVPAGDPGYAKARPTIGIPASQLTPLSGIFGFHPAMAPLMPFWNSGDLAVVHAVGQAAPTRSHFQAMNEMERAAPGSSLRTGWLDRTLGLSSGVLGGVFGGVQMGSSQASGAFTGPSPELTMQSVDGFQISGGWNDAEAARWKRALTSMHAGAPSSIGAPAAAALSAVTTASGLKAKGYTPANGAKYPSGHLGEALQDVARLVKAGVGLRVAAVDQGDWDMHAGMGKATSGWMFDQLTELSGALAAFATDLGKAFDDVTVVTMSEFGRRVGENGSGGVDHGHGNAVLVMGGGVNGKQVHGPWPGLSAADLVDGDLAGATDHRHVLSEILTKRMGVARASTVFPGLSASPLDLVRPRPST